MPSFTIKPNLSVQHRRWEYPIARGVVPATLLAIGMSASIPAWATEQDTPAPNATRRSELIQLVRQDCGSCHGLTLKGGLGPALLPQTLKDKPMDSLKATILQGRPGTAMPPWQRFVTDAEAQWIVTHLQQGFPDAP